MLSDELRIARQKAFLTQDAFAQRIGVAFSTINRWETGKSKPNLSAMKSIKTFCEDNHIPYDNIEHEWLNYSKTKD